MTENIIYEVNLNLKDLNIGVITNMEDNTLKQSKVRWTRLLKSTFKTKANSRNKTRWSILLK